MKSNGLKIISLCLLAVMIVGCSTSNNVASNKLIQKRKYNKGVFIDMDNYAFLKKKAKKSTESATIIDEQIVQSTEAETPVSTSPEVINHSTHIDYKAEIPTVEETKLTKSDELINDNNVVTQEKQQKTVQDVLVKEPAISKKITKPLKRSFVKKTILKKTSSEPDSDDAVLYYILAVVLPWLAVGLVTDWDVSKVIINLLLTLLCVIPGIIHAIITVRDNI